MRGSMQSIWLILAVVAAAGVAISWYFSEETNLAWWHMGWG